MIRALNRLGDQFLDRLLPTARASASVSCYTIDNGRGRCRDCCYNESTDENQCWAWYAC